MQAQRDVVLADDGVGFDYVSLHGDEEHPHRMLAVGVSPAQLDRIRAVAAAADLKLQRIVPEPFGWIELSRRIAADWSGRQQRAAVAHRLRGDRRSSGRGVGDRRRRAAAGPHGVAGVRAETHADDVAALAGELRRTLLSLSQMAAAPAASMPCVYVGERAEHRGGRTRGLPRPAGAQRAAGAIDRDAREATSSAASRSSKWRRSPRWRPPRRPSAPSPVDLLHPHRPPAPPSRRRTYALAGAAAACVALALDVGRLSPHCRPARRRRRGRRASARAGANARPNGRGRSRRPPRSMRGSTSRYNLLTELDYLGQQLRPKPLSDATFNSGEDLIITKLVVAGRQITIDAAARTAEAFTPIEGRLRVGRYRVMRGDFENTSEATPGYAARMHGSARTAGARRGRPRGRHGARRRASGAAAGATTPQDATAAATPATTTTTSAAADTPATTEADSGDGAKADESKPDDDSEVRRRDR